MNSLTETILKNRSSKTRRGSDIKVDDLGIPRTDQYGEDIAKTPDYMVCRALLRDRLEEPYEEDTVNRLHTRQGLVFRGNKEIDETSDNFYLLTGVVENAPQGLKLCFWQELKKRIPSLNREVVKISDRLYWDSKNGEIFEGDYEEFCKKLKKEGR